MTFRVIDTKTGKEPDIEDIALNNTDTELWREVANDYYSPSIHTTNNKGIGINVGGHVIVAPVRKWHQWGELLGCVNPHLHSWRWKMAMWLLRAPDYNKQEQPEERE
jgi:hypothetical protein